MTVILFLIWLIWPNQIFYLNSWVFFIKGLGRLMMNTKLKNVWTLSEHGYDAVGIVHMWLDYVIMNRYNMIAYLYSKEK